MKKSDKEWLAQCAARAMGKVFDQHPHTSAALADELDVEESTVWRWQNGENMVSAENAVQLEDVTGVSRADFRPDLFT